VSTPCACCRLLVASPGEIDEGLHRLDAALTDLESGKGIA
jgi:hypothetical protein